jgi:N4-gp56 family major capsid protein
VAYDLQATTEWITANQFAQSGRQFDGSLGELYGVKFWTTDKAKVWENASNGSGSTGNIDVYSSLFFGADSFGVVDLSGHNMQTIYKPLGSAGTADALNQQQTMGWKTTFGVTILYQLNMIRYESTCSTATNT